MLETPLVGAIVDGVAVGGTDALLLALFGYLFRELRRKDEGVWALLEDRDRRINELAAELRFWRNRALGLDDEDAPPLPGVDVDELGAPVITAPPPAPAKRRRLRQ